MKIIMTKEQLNLLSSKYPNMTISTLLEYPKEKILELINKR